MGQCHKRDTPGEELDGRWEGQHDGQFDALGTVEATEGRVTFPLPTALRRAAKAGAAGADMLIRYMGLQITKAG